MNRLLKRLRALPKLILAYTNLRADVEEALHDPSIKAAWERFQKDPAVAPVYPRISAEWRGIMSEEATPYSVKGHFSGLDGGVRAIYDDLLAKLNALGTIVEDPKKTCIHLNRKSALAGVYVRKGYINLEFKTDYPIDS